MNVEKDIRYRGEGGRHEAGDLHDRHDGCRKDHSGADARAADRLGLH